MSDLALYRKYRPKKFDEVLGQEHVVAALEGSIKKGNIAHAYLFSGTRGTGKTSVARILAREIGCSANDLYEIDAASNRGIDDIRELREGVSTLPLESKYKVYIIDEAHMLTKEAWNALLKTLEEPPPHVVFILATTELEKVPETIVSRCQVYSFRKPSRELLKNLVIRIAKAEGFMLESASADLIAMLGDGSFRDAQGILQKVIFSSKDKKVSIAEVEMVTGAPKAQLVNDCIAAMAKRDSAGAIAAVARAVADDIEMKTFMKLILHKVRAVMLLRYAPEMEKQFTEQFGAEEFTFLKDLSRQSDVNISSAVLYELLGAYQETGRSYIPQLPLELALVAVCAPEAT
ncbi:DNA polymerase III, subunit gamma and tau [Candidatus Kaiserbacteria bacterium RIFCSPHIGHO2_02_FULL_50_9]|uniref:DNA polymerase III subunit gamma/tau n=1 Tax=Candidatus Kaiserbacteria bacterium RIFCSPLOWO2_01_FULL_51_21 TaxID=1798508 RepID=A0A1F6EEH4_9BACT|nr:MAG: DNA polymerase III, subunit gamma and tau [Candidatus Kaiserbacteria bacterium RIFCSPHIGHO2_01_FULL_51_33]OGG63700.1 MAG: DNA polymerase III, subunit gamma and tau [Candidatus Kaiserbacteria bacterium RIFCSPHIGHO2_02_FULL_50_9]OGG72064.1 MAG: DNA polymerase III, subunit gamma and tau [Candidatus Kaiserbacteria bacterium RIFCSPLOWO2_01_FULL_51_21]